jgi:HSP20 family protein
MLLVPSLLSSPRGLDAVISQLFDTAATDAARSPALDVEATDSGYTVRLDMPGVAKEDVKVTVDGKRVTVQADVRADVQGDVQGTNEASSGPRLIYRERSSRRFARSFTLPEALDQAAANAKLEQGVLTLTLAKKTPSAQAITVN